MTERGDTPDDSAAAANGASTPGTHQFSTAWARADTSLRRFVATETGSAAFLLVATIAALIWANISAASYARTWATELSIRVGSANLTADLRVWVNSGLMVFFFLVAGLEARREFDMGELRERRRLALPLIVGLGGMALPIVIYLAFNAGQPTARGWGTAMSTDTAFALGMLALVGTQAPDRVRTYLLTFSIVDDVAGIVIIALAYSHHTDLVPLVVGLGVLGLGILARLRHVRHGVVYLVLGLVAWVAFFKSGIDPVVVGLVIGLLALAYPAGRTDLEQASRSFRLFREQPTPELASVARESVRTALSPNDRLQLIFHPVTSYVIVPIFALANVGITISGGFLAQAYASPVTLGILVGYVAGKPIGTVAAAWVLAKVTHGRIQPPVGWGAVTGAGAIAGIGFTVSLLIATLAFHGERLAEAKLGVLSAAVGASLLTWIIFHVIARLPKKLRVRALFGTSEVVIDLVAPVDPERDHLRGPSKAPVTLVEYGDLECPYCGQAEPIVRELLSDYGDLRYVWRHLPLEDVHPHAYRAAQASEAAAAQGKFWEMHDQLIGHQDELTDKELVRQAAEIGLDVERFRRDMAKDVGVAKIASDVDSADLSGVSGTPTFFVNGSRHQGAFDLASLSQAVRIARARVMIEARGRR
ncbi:MAG TPA: Na+/H+ antiporter NhaA [Streptosporangiaceae bacterium]